MGKPILLLRLEGPLQSWGVRSRWDVRDTALTPSKSGIIGLLGCALGYAMRDPRLEILSQSLRFGVRVETPGTRTTDYQTITDYLPIAGGGYRFRGGSGGGPPAKMRAEGKTPATIISPRTYLEDAAFLIALEAHQTATQVLAACAQAVQQPKWPLFLGRKACVPTRPIFERYDNAYADIEDAFARHPWQWLGAQCELRTRLPEHNLAVSIEREDGAFTVQDVVCNNAARLYGFRREERDFVTPVAQAARPEEAQT